MESRGFNEHISNFISNKGSKRGSVLSIRRNERYTVDDLDKTNVGFIEQESKPQIIIENDQ